MGYVGDLIGVIKGDTRSLDYSSFGFAYKAQGSGFGV